MKVDSEEVLLCQGQSTGRAVMHVALQVPAPLNGTELQS